MLRHIRATTEAVMAGCAKGIEHHKACRSGVRRRSRAAMGSSGIARGGVGTWPSNFKRVHRHQIDIL